MLEMNKIYKWNEIVKAYPDLWVIITNVKEHDGEIESCKLLDVCSKENKSDYIRKYMASNIEFECRRTTFNAPNIGMLKYIWINNNQQQTQEYKNWMLVGYWSKRASMVCRRGKLKIILS